MDWTGGRASFRNPTYVATLAGLASIAALYGYSAASDAGPTASDITVVLLAVFLPTTVAYEVVRRLRTAR